MTGTERRSFALILEYYVVLLSTRTVLYAMNKLLNDSHDLFYELDAYNPRWQEVYSTVRQAASAAGCMVEYYDWMNTAAGQRYQRAMRGVPDTLGGIKRMQEAEENSSLPVKFHSFGKFQDGGYDE